MFKIILSSPLAIALLGCIASPSESPPTASKIELELDDLAGPEPITGTPVMPNPDVTPPKADAPPPKPITYEEMSPAERAVIDRGRDVSAWRGVHDAYAVALHERIPIVRGNAAATQLGIHELNTLGVMP